MKSEKRRFLTGDLTGKSMIMDMLIGIVIGLVSIPISMGYASVAGLPVAYGLYGSLLPIIVFGLLSSSPRFVFGVDAAPAALVGGMLVNLSVTGETEEALKVVQVITFLAAMWLLLFFILNANGLLKFISHPVMGGFITGIGITIVLMQVPKLFGGNAGTGELVELLIHIYEQANEGVHLLSLGLGLSSILIIFLAKKVFPKFPIQVIVMLAGAGLTRFGHIERMGVKTLPAVKSGLPSVVVPDFSVLSGRFSDIVIPSISIAVVIFTETLLATSNLALKYDDKIDGKREIFTYSMGNLVAAIFGVCPVNGSVSRTGIANQYGVKSQVMSLSAGVTMLGILLFGTGFIKYLPVPVLTGIVVSALIGTFEFDLAKKLKKVDKEEYMIFYVVLSAVLIMGTVYGVVVGILLTQVTFIIRQSKAKTAFLGVVENDEGYHDLKGSMGVSIPIKNVVMYRFTGVLFYANIEQFCEELFSGIDDSTKVVVIDATGIGSVDVSAAERLVYLYHKFQEKNIAFHIAGHVSYVNDQLYDFGAGELIEEGVVRSRISLALRAEGLDRPYELAPDYVPVRKPFAKRFAEFSWAYGNRSDERMKKLVHTVAEEIAKEGVMDTVKLKEQAKALAKGYWNDADEAMFLNELEMELAILVEEGKLSDEYENKMEENILERDTQLTKKIGKQGEESIGRLAKYRKKREKAFQKKHPKAYERLMQERKERR